MTGADVEGLAEEPGAALVGEAGDVLPRPPQVGLHALGLAAQVPAVTRRLAGGGKRRPRDGAAQRPPGGGGPAPGSFEGAHPNRILAAKGFPFRSCAMACWACWLLDRRLVAVTALSHLVGHHKPAISPIRISGTHAPLKIVPLLDRFPGERAHLADDRLERSGLPALRTVGRLQPGEQHVPDALKPLRRDVHRLVGTWPELKPRLDGHSEGPTRRPSGQCSKALAWTGAESAPKAPATKARHVVC